MTRMKVALLARALALALALAVLLLVACVAPLLTSAETFVNPDGSVSTVTAGGLVMLTQYTTISIASETRIAPIVDQSQKLYKASFPTWDYSVLSMTNDDALSRMANGTSDIAFRTRPLLSTQATANPDLLQYPLWAEPVVIAYNPVSSKVPVTPWAITRPQACQILTGAISRFNQTGAAASADVFFVPIIADSTSAIQVMMRGFCTKVAVALPTTLSANVTQVAASPNELVGAAVARTPNAIGFMRLSVARLYNLKVLTMVNVATKTVTASVTSTQVAANDLAAPVVTTSTTQLDLFDSPNPLAWPLVLTGYVVIPKQFSRATCAMRYEVMSFLLWFAQSNAVSAIANDNFVYMFSKDLIALMNLITRWRTDVFCDGVVVLPTPRASIVGGVDAARIVANVFLDYYATIDTSYRYTYSALTSSAAVIGLLNTASTTVDVAIVSPMDTNQTVNSSTNAPMSSIASRGGIVFPAFVVGAMPTFVLPAPVAALLTQPSWATVLPLIIDIPTLSNVFQGVITSWLDPALVALNPLLDDVFSAANATAMANFTVVICCSATDDPLTATNTFATSLSVYSSSFSALAPNPMSWLPILRNVPNSNVSGSTTSIATLTAVGTSNFYYESYESRIFPRMTSLGSAIGYQQIVTSTADDTYMFRVVGPALAQSLVGTDSLASYLMSTGSSISGTLVPLATPAAMQQCISDSTLNVQTSVLDLTSGAVSTACWPLSVLTSFVVPASYSSIGVLGPLSSMRTDSCVRGKSALTLAGWLFSDSSVVSASTGWGVVRVGDVASSAAASAVTGLLNGVVCDSTTLLVTPAESWSMASWLKVVGIAVPAVFEVVCLATLLIVLLFRNKAVLKSASVGFLVIILAGLFMLGLSAQMWVSSPGTSTCTSLVWLACIGLTLTFSPLFLKTWRIWKIFERKQLKVVKITNRRLGLMLAVHLAVDVVVLVLWTALAQPGPTTRQVLSGAKYVSYDMCSWSGSTVPFLAVQAVTKGLLFLFGALMSFSTRKVESTFNESQSVAWSVYNVLFSLAIVVPIVYVVDAVGDTLVTLILLLALWVSICTWCFIFLPKLQVLYTGLDANISQSSQSFSSEAPGFSFVSLSNLDKVMLAKYITQLTTHLVQAKKRMQQLGGMPANATSAGDTGAGMGANSQAWGGVGGAGGAGGGAGNSMLGKGGAAVESPGPVSRMGAAMVSPNRGTFAEPKKSTFTSGSGGGGGGGSRYVNPVSTTARSGVASFRT